MVRVTPVATVSPLNTWGTGTHVNPFRGNVRLPVRFPATAITLIWLLVPVLPVSWVGTSESADTRIAYVELPLTELLATVGAASEPPGPPAAVTDSKPTT